MSGSTARASDGASTASRRQLETVLVPAILAGLLVAAAQFLLGRIAALGGGSTIDAILGALIGAIGTVGLIAAVVVLVVAGVSQTTVLSGAGVVYVTAWVSRTLDGIVFGWLSPDLAFVLEPLQPVILFVGVAIAIQWVYEGHPLEEDSRRRERLPPRRTRI